MNREALLTIATVALSTAGCGKEAIRPNTVSGSVMGVAWGRLGSAHWIGMPDPGSPPAILFLTEKPLDCAAVSIFNWDNFVDDARVLEIGLREAAVREFSVPLDANVAYLKGFYNPDADAGAVTITEINPGANMKGSYDVMYATDRLRGTFDATYCAAGVEP